MKELTLGLGVCLRISSFNWFLLTKEEVIFSFDKDEEFLDWGSQRALEPELSLLIDDEAYDSSLSDSSSVLITREWRIKYQIIFYSE